MQSPSVCRVFRCISTACCSVCSQVLPLLCHPCFDLDGSCEILKRDFVRCMQEWCRKHLGLEGLQGFDAEKMWTISVQPVSGIRQYGCCCLCSDMLLFIFLSTYNKYGFVIQQLISYGMKSCLMEKRTLNKEKFLVCLHYSNPRHLGKVGLPILNQGTLSGSPYSCTGTWKHYICIFPWLYDLHVNKVQKTKREGIEYIINFSCGILLEKMVSLEKHAIRVAQPQIFQQSNTGKGGHL